MSSLEPKSSNPLAMTEREHVMVDLTGGQSVNNDISMVREPIDCLSGKETTKRQRHIQKVPPLLLARTRNRECYEPVVVSLGPYHYKQARLAQAERFKLITLEEYRLLTGKDINFLYNKVFEVVRDARKCYIDGSTDAYNDHEFSEMMLRDGCLILLYIECISHNDNAKMMLYNEYLGALGMANMVSDVLLLENQIPFVVLEVLLTLRFPNDKGETVLKKFFNYSKYGEVGIRDEKVLENKHPLHLLELYRSYFISLSASPSPDSNYVRRINQWCASATELKSKWIFLRLVYDDRPRNEDMQFQSHRCYGVLNLVGRAVFKSTKAIYLNMIAYEMCPHNPNDFRVSTYIKVMKSLIIQPGDVKELRKKNILFHSLGHDEEVVKMYHDIEVWAFNLYEFNYIWQGIEKHHKNRYKTWVGELMTDYLGSPWKMLGLLAAAAILFTSFMQTYFATKPATSSHR